MKRKRRRRRNGLLVPAGVVADQLGLSIYTIRRWLKDGTLRAVKKRGRWYASRRALDAICTALSGI